MTFAKHIKGKKCKSCCCSGPKRCSRKDCKGHVHQDVVDEVYDGEDSYWVHNYKCDTCDFVDYSEPSLKVVFEAEDAS